MEDGVVTVQNSKRVLRKLKIELPYNPAISVLGIHPDKTYNSKRYMQPYVHSSTVHNSQDMETMLNVH